MVLGPVLNFDSARLKIKRADHHISDLKAQFDLFIKRDPYRLVVGENPQTGKASVQLKYREHIPDWFALIVGDAVHNLRTALDHMFWEVIGHDGGQQNHHTKFPAYQNRVDFEAGCKGIVTPSQSVKDTFKALEVFPGGRGDALYSLHRLDNADKHTVLMPILGVAKASLRVFRKDGSSQATGITVFGSRTNMLNLVDVPPGGHVELHNNAKATPDIFFDDVQGFQRKPIFPTLRSLRDAVCETLDRVAWAIR